MALPKLSADEAPCPYAQALKLTGIAD